MPGGNPRPAGDLVDRAIEAHGGSSVWASAEELSVRLSSGGFAFASKLQGRAVRDAEGRVATEGQRTVVDPYPEPGHRGVFEEGSVRIERGDGEVVAARPDARSAFGGVRHALWWDRLDMLYFAGFALWTYLSLPFVLARPEYGLRELEPWLEGDETWRRLAVTFPPGVHTHCREQVLHLDSHGLIRRHDYTAEPIGSWAHAAHYCHDHRDLDGLVIATRRRAYPRRRDGRPRRAPLLVWIAVHEARVVPR